MKKFVVLIFIAFGIVGLSTKATAKDSLKGEWSGQYVCNQGLTNFALSLNETGYSSSSYEGVFHFFSHASNPNVSRGKYSVKARELNSEGAFEITPLLWISQPRGYSSAKMSGNLYQNGNVMGGSVDNSGCTSFSAIKFKKPAYPPKYKYCVKETIRNSRLKEAIGLEAEHCFNTKGEAMDKYRKNYLSDPTEISLPFPKKIE